MPSSPYDASQLAEVIANVYGDAQQQLLLLVAKYLERGIDTPEWLNDQLYAIAELNQDVALLLNQLSTAADKQAEASLMQAYFTGATQAAAELGVAATLTGTASLTRFRKQNAFILNRLMGGFVRTREQMGLRIASEAPAIYQRAATLASQRMIGGVLDRRQAAAQVIGQLAEQGVTSFVDRRGRRWDMPSYAEMVTRTMAGQAVIAGHVDQLSELGQDLGHVNDVHEECPRCRPFEGKVLSLKGQTPPGRYDGYVVYSTLKQATAEGLFHPNCRHTINVYIPGITKVARDTEDKEGYQLRQKQRYYERQIRKQKQRIELVEYFRGKNSAEAKAERAKLRKRQAAFKAFRDANNRFQGRSRTSLRVR